MVQIEVGSSADIVITKSRSDLKTKFQKAHFVYRNPFQIAFQEAMFWFTYV